jgi:hypothetical protein
MQGQIGKSLIDFGKNATGQFFKVTADDLELGLAHAIDPERL